MKAEPCSMYAEPNDILFGTEGNLRQRNYDEKKQVFTDNHWCVGKFVRLTGFQMCKSFFEIETLDKSKKGYASAAAFRYATFEEQLLLAEKGLI